MRDSRIRLLLKKGLEPHEERAAEDAAGRFARFGLRTETIRGPDERLWKDLCRSRVYELVFKDGPTTLYGAEPLGRPYYDCRVPHDGAILAGMTTNKIHYSEDYHRARELEGFNMNYVGAVVSVSKFKLKEGDPYRGNGPADIMEVSALIELFMARELGHALLGKEPIVYFLQKDKEKPKRYDEEGNCLAAGCIMENVTDYLSFLRASGAQRLDFCAGCADILKSRVIEIQYYGAA